MRAHEIQAKMFYVSDHNRGGYRVWVEDVTFYEAEQMVMVTMKWVTHPRPETLQRGTTTERMHWTGYWSYHPEVYVIQELP